MKLTSDKAREMLEKARLDVKDDKWIGHSISVRTNSRKNSKST